MIHFNLFLHRKRWTWNLLDDGVVLCTGTTHVLKSECMAEVRRVMRTGLSTPIFCEGKPKGEPQ